MKVKNAYIIAGPNGSGKTTFATEFLPDYAKCPNFVNADLIAQGLAPFSPQQVAIKAGKLVLQQIDEFSDRGVDFGFETTLSGKLHINLFKELKKKCYKLHLFFLWIPGPELAIVRIKDRVTKGGHDVPQKDVKRRFYRSVSNFFKIYRPSLDKWMLFNNSSIKPSLIAKKNNGSVDIVDKELFESIINRIGV